MGYVIAREDLATTTTVPDSLAFVGGQAWTHATGTDMAGIALLKALVYQFQTKVQLPMYHGEDAAGQDVTWYGTTTGKKAVWDESADRLEILGGADLYLEGASASHRLLWDGDNQRLRSTGKIDFRYVGSTSTKYTEWDASANILYVKGGADLHLEGSASGNYWLFDGDNNRVRTVGKIDFRYVGSTAASYVEWLAATNILQTSGKPDVKFVMSGTSLDKEGSRNQFMVDASANVIKLLGWLEVSTVGVSTAISSMPADNTIAYYLSAANSICVAVDTGGGVIQYGKITDTSVAY